MNIIAYLNRYVRQSLCTLIVTYLIPFFLILFRFFCFLSPRFLPHFFPLFYLFFISSISFVLHILFLFLFLASSPLFSYSSANLFHLFTDLTSTNLSNFFKLFSLIFLFTFHFSFFISIMNSIGTTYYLMFQSLVV